MKKNQITGYGGETRTIGFTDCGIATGATLKLLPGTRRTSRVVTYEEQILADNLPPSVVIAGAGPHVPSPSPARTAPSGSWRPTRSCRPSASPRT